MLNLKIYSLSLKGCNKILPLKLMMGEVKKTYKMELKMITSDLRLIIILMKPFFLFVLILFTELSLADLQATLSFFELKGEYTLNLR